MDGDTRPLDDLIERLRRRASDPARRVDTPVSVFSATVKTLSLTDLASAAGSAAADLRRVVEANRAGRIDPELTEKATRIETAMTMPAEPDLRPTVGAGELERAETTLGFALPLTLRRFYVEVANGGVGPRSGLLSLEAAVAAYQSLRADPPGPVGQDWPAGLVPIVEMDPGFDCVEAATGRIVAWDPEELTERSGERGWRRSFKEQAPSLEAWLDAWLETRPFQERIADQVQASMIEQARAARARIAEMSPEERAKMGLPEVGWERVVWGGLGLDEDGA